MRTITLTIACLLMLLLAGCDELPINNKPKEPKTLDGLLAHLETSGCELGEKQTTRTSHLQAANGFEIDIDGQPVKFYIFEEIYSVGDIATKLRSQGIEGQAVLVNENLAMIGDRKQDNWKKAGDAFRSY